MKVIYIIEGLKLIMLCVMLGAISHYLPNMVNMERRKFWFFIATSMTIRTTIGLLDMTLHFSSDLLTYLSFAYQAFTLIGFTYYIHKAYGKQK